MIVENAFDVEGVAKQTVVTFAANLSRDVLGTPSAS